MNPNDPVGLVIWCSDPPVGVSDSRYRFTIIDAIETASTFLWGADKEHYDRAQERLVVGSAWIAYLMRLPNVRREGDKMFLDCGSPRPIVEDKTAPIMTANLYGLMSGLRVNLLIRRATPLENEAAAVARHPQLIH